MPSVFYLTDDTTAATALAFGPTAAGATSATQTLHFWYNKATAGGSIANLSMQAVDPATSLDSGLAWLDEAWLEARINGGANPGSDAAFVTITTPWYRLGPGRVLPMPDLPGNCAYYVELRLHPPMKDGAPTESVNFELRAMYGEPSLSVSTALTESSDTAFATVSYGASSAVSVEFLASVQANDATNYQMLTSRVRVSSVRKATGNTVSTIEVVGTDLLAASSGTLTCTYTVTDGATAATVKANAVSSLTQTFLGITFQSQSQGAAVSVAQL
jgi:hypothetical protein